MPLPDPVKVSPLIKFFRYTFLITGIFYGVTRRKTLQLKEAGKKDERMRLKAERDAKIAEEKRMSSERDIAQIVAIFSEEPKPKFKAEEQTFENVNKGEDQKNKCKAFFSAPSENGQCEIFSKHVDISDKSLASNPTSEKQNAISNAPIQKSDVDIKQDVNEYFVETFKNGVPYAAPHNEDYDFLPKAESK